MSTSYEAEVLARYGETPAFAEYGAKTKKNRTEDFLNAKDALTAVFAEFAVLKASGAGAEGGEASAAPEGMVLTALQIAEQIRFVERYFDSTVESIFG